MWRLSFVDGRKGLPEIACWQVDLTSDTDGFGVSDPQTLRNLGQYNSRGNSIYYECRRTY